MIRPAPKRPTPPRRPARRKAARAGGQARLPTARELLAELIHRVETADERPLSTLEALREQYGADFPGFCRMVKVPAATGGSGPGELPGRPVPFVLTELQAAFDAARTGRDLVLKARKLGMSTLELARDVWYWLMHPGVAVRVLCQTETEHGMKQDFARTISLMLTSLEEKGLSIPTSASAGGKGRWQLVAAAGGGVLEVLEAGASTQTADKKGRGGTTHRLHCTEIAFWEAAAATMDSVLNSVTAPAPATEITIESTPNGISTNDEDARGGPYFHRMWKRATSPEGDEFFPHFFPWYELPERRLTLDEGETVTPDQQPIEERRVREEQCVALGVDQEQLKWFRAQVRAKGLMRVDKELPTDPTTCFIASGSCLCEKSVTERLIAAAMAAERARPMVLTRLVYSGCSAYLRMYEPPTAGMAYWIFGDTSGGEGGDPCALQVWTREAHPRHVATLHGQVRPIELGRLAVAIALRYNGATVAIERNNMGGTVLSEMLRRNMLADVLADERMVRDGFADVPAQLALRQIAAVPWEQARQMVEQGKTRAGYAKVWKDQDEKPGWITSGPSRSHALASFEQAHRDGSWASRDLELLDELRTFVVDAWGRAAARGGANDDLVICAAIGWAIMSRPPPKGPPRNDGQARVPGMF